MNIYKGRKHIFIGIVGIIVVLFCLFVFKNPIKTYISKVTNDTKYSSTSDLTSLYIAGYEGIDFIKFINNKDTGKYEYYEDDNLYDFADYTIELFEDDTELEVKYTADDNISVDISGDVGYDDDENYPGVCSGDTCSLIVTATNEVTHDTTTYYLYYNLTLSLSDTSDMITKFTTSNVYQTFTAPRSGTYRIEAWGAQGGSGCLLDSNQLCTSTQYAGGAGAYTAGTITLKGGTTLYIYTGQTGIPASDRLKDASTASSITYWGGTWNGGGRGVKASSNLYASGSGGGSTDIRTDIGTGTGDWETSLNSRIMVAAGGGGGSYNETSASWSSNGGGLYVDGLSSTNCSANQTDGNAFGIGMSPNNTSIAIGGGGGGWYGGYGFVRSSGDAATGGTGCGGSSYISGHLGSIGVNSDGTKKATSTTSESISDSYSYTGYVFTNTTMIDGYGYTWTTEPGSNTGMPSSENADVTTQGNFGGGKVRITQIAKYAKLNNKLKELNVSDGTLSPDFNSDTFEYTLTLDTFTGTVDIEGIIEDSSTTKVTEKTTYKIDVGSSKQAMIFVTDIATGNVNTYSIEIIRPSLPVGTHSTLIEKVDNPNNETIYMTKNQTTYTLPIKYGKMSVDLGIHLYDSDATYSITGNDFLLNDTGVITVAVYDENVESTVYTFNYVRETAAEDVEDEYIYYYTGSYQTFTAPISGDYKIEAWGAQGGSMQSGWTGVGGKGAYTSGTINLTKDTNLYVYVGGKGTGYSSGASTKAGGWNGGGSNYSGASGGGGSTDIRLTATSTPSTWNDSKSLISRIMVAAGGGGSNDSTTGGYGGALIGGTGGNGSESNGAGGTQLAGGAGIEYGFFGGGANSTVKNTTDGGSGGGGYFGGGKATGSNVAGGGGSSFVSGYLGAIARRSAVSDSARKDSNDNECTAVTAATDITCSYHVSGYVFTDPVMIAGDTTQPTLTTATQTGNEGNGFARITPLSNKSENNFLKDLTFDKGTRDPVQFKPNVYDYTITVGIYTQYITLEGIPYDTTATVEGDGKHLLDLGENEYPVVVTAENGETRTYNVTVIREGLKGTHSNMINNIYIKDYGYIYPEVGIYEYNFKLGYNKYSAELTINLYDDDASYTVNGSDLIVANSGDITILVTHESGAIPDVTYTLHYIRELPLYEVEGTYDYLCTKGQEYFEAPLSGSYYLQTWGASGGGATTDYYSASHGGRGGYSDGTISLVQGETLYINVGCAGSYASGLGQGAGWNGGGAGGGGGYGGGGATDFRFEGDTLKKRILVAGGGGGADNGGGSYLGGDDGSGGVGGGESGENAKINGSLQPGTAGTQDSGYQLGVGQSATTNTDTGGAGGGYWGGKVTNNNNGGAGGGSGFVDAEILPDGQTQAGNTSFVAVDSGYEFGHSGDGHARITVLSYLSENFYLESLTTDIGSWDKTFDPAEKNYTVTVDTYDPSITISATAIDSHATIKGIGEKDLDMGDNYFNIVVTAQDGETRTYTLDVVRPQITDGEHTAELQKIKIDGLEDIICEKGVYEYNLAIPDTWYYLEVTPIAYDSGAKQTLKNFSYIPTSQTATITSRVTGARSVTYKINITKGDVDTIFTYDFECTGDVQEFVAPLKAYYTIQLWGAEGGTRGTGNAGKGGYATGRILLDKGQKIYVYVGCSGDNGGYNGGGKRYGYAGGGGATDIRTEVDDLYTRFLVAGGGGSVGAPSRRGGGGGGLTGNQYLWSFGCGGGAGGPTYGGGGCGSATSGTFGIGGVGVNRAGGHGGSGGGGWYGGGGSYPDGSCDDDRGGGGGSSFYLTEKTLAYTPVGYKLNSDYYLEDAETISGSGTMPNPSSSNSTMVGKSGNGYARIKISVLSDDNFLSKLTVKSGDDTLAYTPTFDLQTQTYNVELDTNQTTVTIQARPDDSTATISGLGDYDISPGETTIPITVTSESGKDRVYNVVFTRTVSEEVKPLNITISGLIESYCKKDPLYCKSDPEEFDADKHSYTMTVPYSIRQLDFNVTKANKNQVVKGAGTISLENTSNMVTIEVQSEKCAIENDESDECITSYTYAITRDMAGDADLYKLEVTNPKKDILFDKDIIEYSISIPYEYTSIEYSYELDTDMASLSVSGNENFIQGWNRVTFTVTAADGTVKTYAINIYREKENSTFLSGIYPSYKDSDDVVTAYAISPDFDRLSSGIYEVSIPNDITELDFETPLESTNSSVSYTCSGGSSTIEKTSDDTAHMKDIPTGYSFVNIKVTAMDNTYDTYKVRVLRAKNNNPYLSSLQVLNTEDKTPYTLTPDFNKDTLEYSASVAVGVTKVTVEATPEVDTSIVSGIGDWTIVPGTNKKDIVVHAEDGTTKTYTLTVYRPPSTNNILDTLSVQKPGDNNTWVDLSYSPSYSKGVYEYSLTVPNEVSSVKVSGTISDTLATIQNNGAVYSLAVGENKIEFNVVSEADVTQTYVITVTREPNSNAFLKSITTSNGDVITMTDHATRTYNINVANAVSTLSIADAVPEASTTTWVYEQVSPNTDGTLSTTETNVFKVTTTAEDAVTSVVYTINVVRDKSDNTNLSWLLLHEGIISPEFDPYTTSYTATVPYDCIAGILDIEKEVPESTVTVSDNINDLQLGENVVTVRVTSESGDFHKDYTITIFRQDEETENNHLFSLRTDKGTLVPSFDKDVVFYTLELPYEEDNITVSADPIDTSGAHITGLGKYTLNVGKNVIGVRVYSADGKERDYQILVTRKPSTEARLKALVLDGVILNPTFNSDTYYYEVSTQERSLTFTQITPMHEDATYEVLNNEFTTTTGTYTVTIRVTAADGVTKKDYDIKVTKEASKNAYLASLEVEGYDLDPEFDKGTSTYTVTVPEGVLSVNVLAKTDNVEATIDGEGIHTLNTGITYITVRVTASAGNTFDYIIKVKRPVSNNSLLESLGIKNGILDITFDPNTYEYIATIPYGEEPELFYKPQSETATVAVSITDIGYTDNAAGGQIIRIYTITVTAEDGTQTVYVLKVKMDTIVSEVLTGITVDNYLLDPTFDSYVTDYYIYQNNEDTSIDITNISTLDPNATYEIITSEGLTVTYPAVDSYPINISGMTVDDTVYDVIIKVTSSDGKKTMSYVLHVYHQAYEDNFLSYIYYYLPQKGTEIYYPTPAFDKYTMTYTVNVDNDVTVMDLEASYSAGLTVTGLGKHDLTVGLNVLTITTEKNGTKRTYIINVTRAKNSNNLINSLSLTYNATEYANSLSPKFDETVNDYTLKVGYGTKYLNVSANIADTSTITGDGQVSTPIGTTTIKLVVTSESGLTNTYNIVVTREASSDKDLIELTPSSGDLDPAFTLDGTTYNLTLGSNVAKLWFDAKTSDETATISGIDEDLVPDGASVRTITVEAEDGTQRIYTINIFKYANNNVYLQSLQIGSYTLSPTFDKNIEIYQVTVPYSMKVVKASDVSAVPEDSGATVTKTSSISPTTTSYTDFAILVTGGDGSSTKTYHLQIKRELGSDSTLASLKTNTGYIVEKFAPKTTSYTYMVPTTQTSVSLSDFTYTLTNPESTVTSDPAIDLTTATLPMVFNIRVASQDGLSSTTYEITLKWDYNTVNTLASLSVQYGYMVQTFKAGLYTYDVYEYASTVSDVVTATTTSDKATILSGTGAVTLTPNSTFNHYISIQAEDGSILQYVIIFHVTYSEEENLASFALEGLTDLNCDEDECYLIPSFDGDVIEYSIAVPYDYVLLDWDYQLSNTEQTAVFKIDGKEVNDRTYKLPVGTTPLTIEVYDGLKKLTKTYTINIERHESDNAFLTSLKVTSTDGKKTYPLTPTFQQDIYEYSIDVENDVDEVLMSAKTSDSNAKVKFNGYNYLFEGDNLSTATVTAPDGTVKTYVIHIVKQPVYDSWLSSLTVSTGEFHELTPSFRKTVKNYTLTLSGEVDQVYIDAIPDVTTTTVRGTGTYDLELGMNVINVIGTAIDGSTSVYTLGIVQEASDDDDLKSLDVEGVDVNPKFDPTVVHYTATVDETVTGVNVTAIPKDPRASVYISGNNNLVTGTNIVSVQVVSQSKAYSKTYQIVLTRPVSSNAYLNGIDVYSVSGATDAKTHYGVTPEFKPKEVFEYETTVPYDISGIYVEYTKTADTSKVVGGGYHALNYGENEITLTVTAEDGKTQQTYKVKVTRAYNLLLDTLEYNTGTLSPEFDSKTKDYTLTVTNDTKRVYIRGTAATPDVVTVNGNSYYPSAVNEALSTSEPTKVTLTLTAADGTTGAYTITIIREKNSDPYASMITIDEGALTTSFVDTSAGPTHEDDDNKQYYVTHVRPSVLIANGGTGSVTFNVTPKLATTTLKEIKGNENLVLGNNDITVTMLAEDGVTTFTYNFRVIVESDEYFSNELSSLSVIYPDNLDYEINLSPNFDKTKNSYTASVANSVDNIQINATAESTSTITGDTGVQSLVIGRNQFQIKVTSADGNENIYSIVIMRLDDNANLASLVVKGHSFVFAQSVYEYSIDVGEDEETLSITAVPFDPNATVEIIGARHLAVGFNKVYITVTTQSGKTQTYILTAIKGASKNPYLSTLEVEGYTYLPAFDPTATQTYRLTVKSNINSVNIIGTVQKVGTTCTNLGVTSLEYGENNIAIVCTAGDTVTTHQYDLDIIREASSDTNLETLTVSYGSNLDTFYPKTDIRDYYDIELGENDGRYVTINATASDDSSTVTGTGQYFLTEDTTVFPITVTAQDGSKSTYRVRVKAYVDNTPTLSSMYVEEGQISPSFNSAVTTYSVHVPNEITTATVKYTTTSDTATAHVTGNENLIEGTNEVTVTVLGSGGETKEYTIYVIRDPYASNKLAKLTVKDSETGTQYSLDPTFDGSHLYYEVTVPNTVEKVRVSAVTEDTSATVAGNKTYTLNVGVNYAYVLVTSGLNYTRTYTVVITRQSAEETTTLSYLTSLTEDYEGADLVPEFNSATTTYSLTVSSDTQYLTLNGTTAPGASATGFGKSVLKYGTNQRTITVTGSDSSKTSYYVNITRPYTDYTAVENIVPSVGTLDYDPNITEYDMNVEATVSSISFEVTTKDPFAKVSGNESTPLVSGKNIITITITGTNDEEKIIHIFVNKSTAVQDIELEKHSIILGVGEQIAIDYDFTPSDTSYTNVTWSIDNEDYATVAANGLITGVSPGTSVVTITSDFDSTVKDTVTVKVIYKEIKVKATSGYEVGKKDAEKGYLTNYVYKTDKGVKINEYMTKFMNNDEYLHLYDATGAEVDKTSTKILPTGYTLKLIVDDKTLDEAKVVVMGDSSCDGYVTAVDLGQVKIGIANKSSLDWYQLIAIDMNYDGYVTAVDTSQVKLII